ncbi:MAG: hypothetical protein R2788_02905 [Saprospiraceae bacterium]
MNCSALAIPCPAQWRTTDHWQQPRQGDCRHFACECGSHFFYYQNTGTDHADHPARNSGRKNHLRTPEGDISSISSLTISEPIVLTSLFSPATVRPGNVLTLTGDYLNLIAAVIFHADVSVGDTAFISRPGKK